MLDQLLTDVLKGAEGLAQVFVRESSMVPVYSILLFGGEITVLHEKGLLKVRPRAYGSRRHQSPHARALAVNSSETLPCVCSLFKEQGVRSFGQ